VKSENKHENCDFALLKICHWRVKETRTTGASTGGHRSDKAKGKARGTSMFEFGSWFQAGEDPSAPILIPQRHRSFSMELCTCYWSKERFIK
jgi:hypothetical protein